MGRKICSDFITNLPKPCVDGGGEVQAFSPSHTFIFFASVYFLCCFPCSLSHKAHNSMHYDICYFFHFLCCLEELRKQRREGGRSVLVNHPLSVPSLGLGREGLRVSRGKHPEEPGRERSPCLLVAGHHCPRTVAWWL